MPFTYRLDIANEEYIRDEIEFVSQKSEGIDLSTYIRYMDIQANPIKLWQRHKINKQHLKFERGFSKTKKNIETNKGRTRFLVRLFFQIH